jgi:uncharacterized protein (TIGR03435 family)
MVGKILAVGIVGAGMAVGQTATAPAAAGAPATAAVAPAKAYAFEVVSIRQNKSPQPQGGAPGATPDGYRRNHIEMWVPLMTAYLPQAGGMGYYLHDQIKGLPDWADSEKYDIDARIGDEDRADWQKPESQKVMLQAMLQAMFAERCKMAVHREVKEVGVSSLVVAKGGPKFKETDPTVEHPEGMKLPWGGVLAPTKDGMSFYGATMASFASILSSAGGNGAGRTIQDKTGLTGKYDIVLKFPAYTPPAPNEPQGGVSASDPGSMVYSMVESLGLKLESAKGQVETLVIDHMERPSAN